MWKVLERFRPRTIDDPVFGHLRFIPVPRDRAASYWEGSGSFEPTGSTVEYFVEAGEAGPDETHRTLYRRIETQWDELSEVVGRELIDHHRLASGVAPRDVWAVYSLTALTVPRPDQPGMQWELSFDSTEDDHLFTVIMRGWEPAGVRMDG